MKFGNIILALAIVCGVAFLSGLGFWQVKRLAWKQAMIARVENNLTGDPSSMASIAVLQASGEDFEYRPVHLSGRFDHHREQHFFATHGGNPGYFVYTPLLLDTGEYVFVNRGYVPIQRKQPDSRQTGQITDRVEILGLARSAPEERPNRFVPDNNWGKNVFHWKSLDEMTERAFASEPVSVVGFFVDSDASPVPGGLPVGGVTRVEFPNSHLHYALTWFGLAGALLIVGGYFLFGRLKSQPRV
jgi:surfeit locus 1 family protein